MKLPTAILLSLMLALPVFAQNPVLAKPAATETPSDHQGSQRVLTEAADGTVLLHSRDVTVHGGNVRYEPKPEKNTIGFWTRAEDWVSWEFDLPKAGEFEVELLQGCGKGQGGSEIEVGVADQKLAMTVEDTGHFQNFIPRKIGTLKLAAGRNTLFVKPTSKKAAAVMDLRQVLLRRRK